MYNFQEFEKTSIREEDRITVTKSSAIGFPTKFYNDNNLKDFKWVVLFFDPEQKAVGIHITNNEEKKNKFAILRSKKGYGGQVVVRNFFKLNNIDVSKYYGRYEWEKFNQESVGELFVIKLTENPKSSN